MAGISSKEIKNRIRSMRSTMAITKAMEMVAASKLHRSQARVLSFRPYFDTLHATIHAVVNANRDFSSVYLLDRPVRKSAWIVIAGDRGLAGGYNSNVLKGAWKEIESKETVVLPIGKKTAEFFLRRKCALLSDQYAEADNLSIEDCFSIARLLCKRYLDGEFEDVHIVYTNFISVLSQAPVSLQILPIHQQSEGKTLRSDILYEPDSSTVFDVIVPEYVGGILYGALCESRAAEHAARRTAMSSATNNANELIEELSLKYNRVRQAAITQEITEIMAGYQNA